IEFSTVIEESIINPEKIYLPSMLIQPFIENAIIHGLVSKKGDRKLTIKYYIERPYLVILIDDNGVGRGTSLASKSKGYKHKSWATEIVTDRIKMINDMKNESILLHIHDKFQGGEVLGTTVVLK